MNEDHHHNKYSLEDIEKYHRGELSAADMHAMEKDALNDPFLADAMEGYSIVAARNAAKDDITELQQRLAQRVEEKDDAGVFKFSWWKVAAVVFLFLGAGWIYISINKKDQQHSFAKQDQQEKQQPLQSVPGTADSPYQTHDTTPSVPQDMAVNNKAIPGKDYKKQPIVPRPAAPVTTSNAPQVETEKNELRSEPAIKEEQSKDLAKNFPKQDNHLDDKKIVGRESYDSQVNVTGNTKQPSSADAVPGNAAPGLAITSNSFNGTVVDPLNKPLSNATVQVPSLNKAFVTDNKGNFSFSAPDTAVNVSIASVGFEQQNIRLNNNIMLNQVVLKPANKSLNDVVVTGYGAKRKESRRLTKDFSINVLDAEPVIDWNEYTQYLEKNKRVNDAAKDTHGDVVVSFVINSRNELTNFKIEKPLQEQLDAEAIRLIKEGPSWKLLKGKKAKASVIVKF